MPIDIPPACYSDDQLAILAANSEQELELQILRYYDWCRNLFMTKGMTIRSDKTDIVAVKGQLQEIVLDHQAVRPKKLTKFLGYTLDAKMSPTKHIEELVIRVRAAAYRMISWKNLLDPKQMRILYMAWINGIIMSNAAVFLPQLGKSLTKRLQVAANCGIRAIIGARIKHKVNTPRLREKLNIPSISMMRNRVAAMEAWKRRKILAQEAHSVPGPTTRARATGGIRPKNKKDWLRLAYNQLSPTLRIINNQETAKKIIKRTYASTR